MEKKNVTMNIPTIEQLKEMKQMLLSVHKKENGLMNYVAAKELEHVIINGGMETFHHLDYRMERIICTFYPSELQYARSILTHDAELFSNIVNRGKLKKYECPLDDLKYFSAELKESTEFIKYIIELYSQTIKFQLGYRFENEHDPLIESILDGTVTNKLNYISDTTRDFLIYIDPIYALHFKNQSKNNLFDSSIGMKLYYALDFYAARYHTSDFYGKHEDLFNEHNGQARQLLQFIEKNK